jgi:hypothetical protein
MSASPRSRSRFSLVVALFPWLIGLISAACGRVPGQFEILNDQIPPATGACVIPAQPSIYRGEGTLDVSGVRGDFETAYYLFPLIENNLPSSGSAQDPNQIQISGFDVDISVIGNAPPAAAQVMATVDPSLLHFRVPWSGGVSSGGGQITAITEAFPVALAQALYTNGGLASTPALTLMLTVQALGATNSGRSLTSDPFHFPLDVCKGCLGISLGPCPLPFKPTNSGNSCNPAQDESVDCCTDNGVLVCPATWASQ